jgi:transcriptional regulator
LPETETHAHLERLSAFFEARLLPKKPWTIGKLDDARRAMLVKAIVSIVLDVDTIEGQDKLIQHKGETEHRGAIAALSAMPDAGSQSIADLMRETALRKFGS